MHRHRLAALRATPFAVMLLATSAFGGNGSATPAHASYLLDVTLRPEQSRLDVTGTVRLEPTSASRDTIGLFLSSWMPTLTVSVVEPTSIRAARITTDSANGDRTWKVALHPPLPSGTPITLAFRYVSDSVWSSQLRVSPEGSLAGGGGEIWYPRLAFDSLSTGVLRFHVPAGETVISNGLLARDKSDPARGLFEFHVASGARFGFASARYVSHQLGGEAPVTLYLLRERPDADSILRRVARLRAALEEQFGPMAQRSYAVAEVEFGASTGGTSEFGFFLADRSYVSQGLPIPFIGHELGHAWWGNGVTTKPGPGRTFLTEGIASFGMLRAIEAVEGLDAADRFRRSVYPGSEASNSPAEYFALSAAGIEQPIASFVPKSQYEILTMHRMANTRGWFVLDMLSREIGRSRFAAILRTIAANHAGSAISFAEFRDEVERRAGRDVRWFFDDWLARTGAPTYALRWQKTTDGVAGTITQPPPIFRATIPLELLGSSGRRLDANVWVNDTIVNFRLRAPFVVREVLLDPEYHVLRWTPQLRARSSKRAALTRADFERRFGSAARAVPLFRAALDSGVEAPDTTSIRFSLEYGFALAALATRDSAQAFAAVQRAVALPSRDALALPRAYLLLARLAHARGDDELAVRAARDAVAADALAGNKVGAADVVKTFSWMPAGQP